MASERQTLMREIDTQDHTIAAARAALERLQRNNRDLIRGLTLILYKYGPVALTRKELVAFDYDRHAIFTSEDPQTGDYRYEVREIPKREKVHADIPIR